MTLRSKLLAGFVFVSVVTMVVGLFSINRMHVIDDNSSILYQRVTVPLSYIADIAIAFQRFRVNLAVLVGTKDEQDRKEMTEENKKLSESTQKKMQLLEATLQSDEDKKLFSSLVEARNAYTKIIPKIIELVNADKHDEAEDLLLGDGRKAAHSYRAAVDKFFEAKNTQGQELAKANTDNAQSSSNLLYIVMGLAIAASIGLGLFLTSSVSAQLGEDPGYLYEVANIIAGGDLSVTFRPQKKEGGVYSVMQGMVKTMKAKIAEADQKTAEASQEAQRAKIATDEANEAKAQAERAKAEGMLQAANQLEGVVEIVTSASEELSAQIEQSSRGSEEQSHRVAETATAMEEMNATVLEVAKSASQAAETAGEAKAKAEDGSKIVRLVVKGIEDVQHQSQEMKADMSSLGKQAEGIGQIMNVISDIADQTNLLALNAAIEAARAGEAGRGFAVVADEVRKLAEKTMTATKEVGDAIRGIQDGTKKNIENVERSGKTIEEATVLAGKSGDALNEIVSLVDSTTDQVRSIATASEQQSAASEEINHSIEDVSRISSETSDAMRQSAQAVSELAHQAQILKNLIEEMKAEGSGGRQALPSGRRALS